MADRDTSLDYIYETIEQIAKTGITPTAKAHAMLELAEAAAWLISPSNPHGGSSGSD